MPNPFPQLAVPLVGQPLKAHDGCVMATMTCLCRPTNAPLLIRGTDLVVICRFCRNVYGITKVEFDRATGDQHARVYVSIVGHAAVDGETPEN